METSLSRWATQALVLSFFLSQTGEEYPLPTVDWFLLKKKILVYFLWKTVPYAFITVQSHSQPPPSQEIFY